MSANRRPYNMPYSLEEQTAIIKYILDNNAFSRTKGDALWREMEHDGVTNRSWQSLKQHFRTTLIYRLALPQFRLTGLEIDRFKEKFFSKAERANTSRKNARKPTKNLIRFSSSDSDSERETKERKGEGSTITQQSRTNGSQETNQINTAIAARQVVEEVTEIQQTQDLHQVEIKTEVVDVKSEKVDMPVQSDVKQNADEFNASQ